MTTDTSHTTLAPGVPTAEPVRIRAHSRSVKKLGQWTTQRAFDVAASRGSVVLDLLLPQLEPGEIEIHFDLDPLVTALSPSRNAVREARRDGHL